MKKIIIMVLATVFITTFAGCGKQVNLEQSVAAKQEAATEQASPTTQEIPTTSNNNDSTQGTNSGSSDDDPAQPQVHLDSVTFIGEFQSIIFTNTDLSGSEEEFATDIVPLSRFVICRYDFTTLDLAGGQATYGGTVSVWKGTDMNSADAGIGGKYFMLDDPDATFENGVFTVTGNPSMAFTYDTNEKHAQYRVMIVPDSVSIDNINIHFSKKSTISEIGFDFMVKNSISTVAVKAANNTDIPFTKTVKGWFNDAVGWLKGIIISLLFIGALFLLGTTGRYLRRGIKIKKSLNKARRDALLKGLHLNTNYFKFKKKSTLYIVLPVLFWMSAYGILFMILTLGQFYGSLFVLITPILGFFGVSIVPSDDLSDYF